MLVAAGFVSPARGPRNAWRFSFQDLIVLRTAQALAAANAPARRIARSVKEKGRSLPKSRRFPGLCLAAARDGGVAWGGSSLGRGCSGHFLRGSPGSPG